MQGLGWIAIALSSFSILLIPAIGLLVRLVVKWTRVEGRLADIAEDMKKLIQDKDKVHQEMIIQMREDRQATDTRLRWLEQNIWKRRP